MKVPPFLENKMMLTAMFPAGCAKKNPVGVAMAISAYLCRFDKDKGGVAYILHPIRSMMRLRSKDEVQNILSIMHDCIEDHGDELTFDMLEVMGFHNDVIVGLKLLTHAPEVPYDDYVKNMAENELVPVALRIKVINAKIEDLRDNSDIMRLKGVSDKDFERVKKYHRNYLYLIEAKARLEARLYANVH